MTQALLAGFGLGFAVAAGFGPINVFCLGSGLRHGFRPALGVGAGAAAADGTYALLASVGAAALVNGRARGPFELVGGAALLLIALRMARPGAAERRAESSFGRTFRLALAATLANPLTIVSWAAVFAGVVPRLELSRLEAVSLLPPAVALGTMTWFSLVAAGSAYARRYVTERLLRVISFASALAIAAFGVWFVVSGARTVS